MLKLMSFLIMLKVQVPVAHRVENNEQLMSQNLLLKPFDLKGLPEEEFKDIKGKIRIRKSKKDRQHNGQKKKNKNITKMMNFKI